MSAPRDANDQMAARGRYSAEELAAGLSSLSRAEMAKLIAVARHFAARCGLEHHDLLQEAFCRILEGRRTCKRHIPILEFVCGVLKSLASDEIEAKRKGRREISDGNAHREDSAHLWRSEDPSPEHQVLSRLTDGDTIKEIERRVAGDEQLELLLEGIADGMQGEELQELLGIDAKGLAAARKRLKRRLNAVCPGRKA